MPASTFRRALKNVRVHEVSLVDRPANEHAKVVLHKRDDFAGRLDALHRRLDLLEKSASASTSATTPPAAAGRSLVDAARERGEAMRRAAARGPLGAPIAKRQADPTDTMAGAKQVLRRARLAKGGAADGAVPVRAEISVSGVDGDRRYVAGWASVIEIGGEVVVDTQRDTIDEEELVRSAHEFMREYRVGKAMHAGEADKVEYVESIVFTKEVQKALGVDLGRVGWWVAGFVRDDATWRRVKAGEMRSLSVGGTAVRVEG